MMETTVLVFLALVATVSAGPIAPAEQCAITCTDSAKFRYAPGTTYIYDYRVDTTTSMAGASESVAKLSLQATAEFEVLGQCELALRIRNTRLYHSEGNGQLKAAERTRQFQNGLENSVVRFSFQDGIVEQVCLEAYEHPWTLNIKKGILSAFQNSMENWSVNQNLTETDTVGECKTEYQLVSRGYYTTTVKKVKDALTCFKRHDFRAMYHLMPYRVESDVQSLPIMKTTHECEQDIENKGLLKSSTCTETHVYRPFSNGQSGGATSIQQSLTYKEERRGIKTRESHISSRRDLTFDHSENELNQRNARLKAEQTLRSICWTTQHDVQPETPQTFSELVSNLRSLNEPDLEDLHRQLKSKTMCPSNDKTYTFFLDALPMTATGASVKLMTTLLTREEVTGMQAKAWLLSFAFISSPGGEIMKEIQPLLENEKLSDSAMLPVSSLINNFCEKTKSCDQHYAVAILISALQDKLGFYCDARGDKLQKVLLTLRAIGNAGSAVTSVGQINHCLTAASSPLEIKIAAAEAFRRMSCDVEASELWNTFDDQTADSELRIASYLALMRCPDVTSLSRIVSSLESGMDDQLGAFIYSHLNNIKESSNPHKQDLAKAIEKLSLKKDFILSVLKSSRNLEASMLLNKINTGFTAESNVIWSSESQLPRSFSGNLTFELFGDSINLLDFGGRLEGLEYLIRSAFGSYMPEEKGKRSKMTQELDDVKGSVYGRMFGNEMIFQHSSGVTSPLSKLPKSWLDLLIDLSKHHDYSFTHSHQFMDVRMTIPSCAGLPIHVTVNGTASVDLKLSGKMDLRKVASKPRSLDIDGEIRPSGSSEITGSLAVDAFVTKTGLRMRNTLFSSTAMKGHVQLERGQQLNIEFDIPEEKTELFDARSRFFIIHNDVEQEQDMIKDNRKELKLCSGDTVATVTGMELCGELQFPNTTLQTVGPYFPLTGPSSLSITLHKRDSHTGYKMFAKRVENKRNSIAQILFNTPGSKINRAISLDMILDYPQKEIDITMASPWKKAALKGALVNAKNMRSVSGTFIIDETDTYAMMAEVKMTQKKNKLALSPMFELRRPGADNIQLTGAVNVERPVKSVSVDLSLFGLDKMPYTLKGNFANTQKDKSLALTFSPDSKEEYNLKVINQLTPVGKKGVIVNSQLELTTPSRKLMTGVGKLDYRTGKSLKMDSTMEIYKMLKKSSLTMSFLKNELKNGVKYNSDVKLKSARISGRVTGQSLMKKSGFLASKMMVEYNIPKVAKNRVTMSTKFNDRSTKAFKRYNLKSNVDFKRSPEYNVGLNLALNHKKKLSEVNTEIRYGPNPKDKTKKMHLNAIVKKNIKNYKNALLNYKITARAPEHKIDVFLNGKHQHSPKLIDSSVQLNYAKGKNIKADVFFRDRSSKFKMMNGKMNLSWPGKEYVLTSNLAQKSAKQFSHVISLKDNHGMKHEATTVYKMVKGKTHTFNTALKLDQFKPMTVMGSATLDPRNFYYSGQFQSGKDRYGLSAKGKVAAKSLGAKVDMELFYPNRKITVHVDGGQDKNKVDGKMGVDWDAKRKKNSKMALEGSFVNKMSKEMMVIGGHVDFSSPFDKYEKLGVSLRYSDNKAQHDITGKISMGSKSKELSGSLNMKKPLSIYNIQMLMKMKTPIRGLRTLDAEISHKMDPSLATVLKGSVDQESVWLSVTGENRGKSWGYHRDFKANLMFNSTIRNAELLTLSLAHADNSQKFINNWVLKHNGQTYSYDMSMDHYMSGWDIQNDGDITVRTPYRKISTNWQHKSSDQDIKTSLNSKWGGESLYVAVTGTHKVGQYRILDGSVTVQSPWRNARNLIVSLNQKTANGFLYSNSHVKEMGKTVARSEMNYKTANYGEDFDLTVVSPYHDDITAKINTRYEYFPYTTSMEIQWSPRKAATFSGSVTAKSWDDLDLNVKLTTPVCGFRNVLLKATNKMEGEDMIAHANVDYGVRESIDVESRVHTSFKLIQLKLTTPFPELTSLKTDYTFMGYSSSFDTKANFELQPYVGKVDGSFTFDSTNDFSTRLRLDTTFKDYPYFEASMFSKKKGALRESNARVEYHPRQVFNLDTSYRFDLPIAFEASIRSPYPEFHDMRMAFHHEHSSQNIKTHGEIVYQPYNKFEGDLVAEWTRNIEASLMVKTPFAVYENNKIILRHSGGLESFNSESQVEIGDNSMTATAAYNGGYTTTGSLSFTSSIPGLENIRASMKKRGHLRNLKGNAWLDINNDRAETTFNHKWTTSDLKSSISLTTPYTEDLLKLSVDHSGDIVSFNNKMSMNYGRQYDIDTVATFDYRDTDVAGNGMIKYRVPGLRDTVRISFSKNGRLQDLQFGGTGTYNRDSVSVTGSWKLMPGLDANLEVKTPLDNFNNIGMTVSFNGNIDDMRGNANIKYMDNKSITGKVEFSHGGGRKLNLKTELVTPFPGFETTEMNIDNSVGMHVRDIVGTAELKTTIGSFGTSSVSYQMLNTRSRQSVKGKVTKNGQSLFDVNMSNIVEGTMQHAMVSLKSMVTDDLKVNIDLDGDLMAFQSSAECTYGRLYTLKGEMNMKATRYAVEGDGKIIYDLYRIGRNTMSLQVTQKGSLDDITVEVVGKHGRYESSLKGGLKNKENFESFLTVTTPFDDYRQIGGSVKHSGTLERFSSSLDLKVRDDQQYTGKVDFYKYLLQRIETNIELTSPITGFEMTKFEYRHEGERDSFKCFSALEYGNSKKVIYDLSVSQYPKPEFKLNLKTPYDSYDDLLLQGSYQLTGPNYAVDGTINAGNGNIFTLNGGLDSSSDVTGFLFVTSPFEGFTDLSSTFSHKGDSQKFDSELQVTYMNNKHISGKVDFYNYRWRKVVANAEINTPFTGMERTKLSLTHEDRNRRMTSTMSAEYGNNKKMDTTVKLTYDPNYDIDITLRTPMLGYRKLQAKGSLDITGPSYGMTYNGNYGYNTAHSVVGKANIYSLTNLDGSIEINLPIAGYETTMAEYTHKMDSSTMVGTASVTYGRSQTMSASLKSVISPNYAATLTVKTPFYGYETMEAYTSLDTSFNKYDTVSRLDLGRGQVYAMTSGLDYSVGPMSIFTKLSTPHSDYRQIEMKVTHEGTWNNFQCTAAFNSPMTDDVNGQVKFNFQSPLEMNALVAVQSSLPGMDDIKVQVKSSDVAGEKKGYAELQWTQGQQMSADVAFRKQEGWYETKMMTDVNVATPFETVRSAAIQTEYMDKQGTYSEKVVLSVNQDQILNMDTLYSSKSGHQLEVSVREPRPMQFTGKIVSGEDQHDAEIYLNWDRDELESNVNIKASLTDKPEEQSMSVGLVHPVRSIGFNHKCVSSYRKTSRSGQIYWNTDDTSRLCYEMEVTDKSRRGRKIHDGKIKLGFPARSLGMTGSYSESAGATSIDGAFSWDADRDMSKKVEMSMYLSGDDQKKGDVTIRLPSFNKEIKVGGEMMISNGRVIFDTKTDISYSPDTRKTLTLISKLEDVSYTTNGYNYSFEIGVKHPYTRVDLQMISHIGASEEKMTFAVDTQYLTAMRQMKNLVLFSEIDKLRSQMKMLAHNGKSKLEMAGDLLSVEPYKVHVTSSVDDENMLDTELTLDTQKKAVLISSQYDTDGRIIISAMYPNSTAINAFVTHHSALDDHQEMMFVMRLNTSQVLHTRLTWRTELPSELREYGRAWAKEKGEKTRQTLKTMSNEFRDELSAKYQAIASAVTEEAEPVLVQMRQELEQVSQQLKTLVRNFDRMYSRNDLHIQEWQVMGVDFYGTFRDWLVALSGTYHLKYTAFLDMVTRKLRELPQLPISQQYDQFLAEAGQWLDHQTDLILQEFNNYLASLDNMLSEIQRKMQAMDYTTLEDLQNMIDQLARTDLSPYLSYFRIPERYTSTISNASDVVLIYVSPLLDRPELVSVKGGLNEVYQQGVWAYNYWQVEENIHRHLKNILHAISEIIKVEIEEQVHPQTFTQNPIVQWHPESGYIQATFMLPKPIERLDTLPDFTPFVNDVEAMIDRYTPDQSTMDSFTKVIEYLTPSNKAELKEKQSKGDSDDKMKKRLKNYRPKKHQKA